MSIFDALMGKTDFQARAPRLNTKAGQQAIQDQARLGAGQAQSQQYSLAASAGNPLAFREAQRMGAQAQGQIYNQAGIQQQQLQQAALQQQAQSEMQAQQINSQIAQSNAQGLQKLAGTALTAAAFMSDARQKEFYGMPSDFQDKQLVRPMDWIYNHPRPEPARETTTPMRTPTTLEQAAAERATIEQIQNPTPEYQPQALRDGATSADLSNSALAQHFRDQREAEQLRQDAAAANVPLTNLEQQMAAPHPMTLEEWEAAQRKQQLMGLGQGLMPSDYVSKEMVKVRPSSLPVFSLDPARLGRVAEATNAASQQSLADSVRRQEAFEKLRAAQQLEQDRAAGVARSRRDLGPVQPVVYRYNPESSTRQALQTAETPQQAAMVYADKRTPRTGIVAQDLQKSPAFAPAVKQTPAGLAVDRDRALSASLFELAGLDKRLRMLEGAKKR